MEKPKRNVSLKEMLLRLMVMPIIASCVAFLISYLAFLFLKMLVPAEKTDHVFSIFTFPLKPAGVFSAAAFYYGMMAYDFKNSRSATLFGSLWFGIPACIFIGYLFCRERYFPGDYVVLYMVVIVAAIGAIIGGLTSIIQVGLSSSSWPRFTLREMLVGFFLMAVIFGCLTAFVRQSPVPL
jgi:hypothetical protein